MSATAPMDGVEARRRIAPAAKSQSGNTLFYALDFERHRVARATGGVRGRRARRRARRRRAPSRSRRGCVHANPTDGASQQPDCADLRKKKPAAGAAGRVSRRVVPGRCKRAERRSDGPI
jgi:hypothetical protein